MGGMVPLACTIATSESPLRPWFYGSQAGILTVTAMECPSPWHTFRATENSSSSRLYGKNTWAAKPV